MSKTSDEFWRLPSLEERQLRQVRTTELTTGKIAIARACRVTNDYVLVRLPPADEDANLVVDGLSPDDRHFVEHNETRGERAAREGEGEDDGRAKSTGSR
ncbi:MAG: hypothetical protein V4696_03495 [Pseudomonadota bacterium]